MTRLDQVAAVIAASWAAAALAVIATMDTARGFPGGANAGGIVALAGVAAAAAILRDRPRLGGLLLVVAAVAPIAAPGLAAVPALTGATILSRGMQRQRSGT